MKIGIFDLDSFVYLPEITVVITTLYLLLRMVFFSKEEESFQGITTSIYLGLIGLIVSLVISLQFINLGFVSLQRIFSIDELTLFLRLPILFTGLLVVLISADFFQQSRYQNEYYILLFLSLIGTFFVISANDLVSIYIALELCSIPTYILAGLDRNNPKSTEGAVKYFLLGILGSVTMLYGFSFLYGLTGTTNLQEMAKKLFLLEQPLIFLSMSFVIFGLGIKIAAVPFHFRLPDAYEGAPTPVTAYLSVGPKIAGFAIILRIFLTIFSPFKLQWMTIFALLSVASMTVGNLLALMQQNVKRMLAYSSIAHTGYLLVGLAVADRLALSSMLFYLFVYLFANLGVFAIVIANSKEGELIEDFAGFNQRFPFFAVTMVFFLLSLAGVPPLAGFMGKLYLFSAAVRSGYT
ncbi:MAG TPA: NADH-quinone oxidoreductase subunit N, partial [Elusimicrobia bacterium]|nr:NADH-quinone oxidoreductase subunit N [Elusimicrobiota bacterium]